MLVNSLDRPWTSDGFRTSWAKVCAKANISSLTFHDLRGSRGRTARNRWQRKNAHEQVFTEHTSSIGIGGLRSISAGGMTVSGLRRETARGRLEIEVIAGKHFTTLAAIARMRQLTGSVFNHRWERFI